MNEFQVTITDGILEVAYLAIPPPDMFLLEDRIHALVQGAYRLGKHLDIDSDSDKFKITITELN